ncbi:ankyrin repeat-containing protein [Striga asiatica]|uniref:Ankyrin repeat-containing protein n=1 Tax=Striga asiatica TaxID=4170 RepID=A0A5A7P9S5_STRAF|nr:ankyrin repeat-containing protein [Striga asiatica]
MAPPTYFPLRWESTGDQWWYATPIDWAAANGHYDLVRELLLIDGNHIIKLTSLRRIRRLETVWDDDEQFHDVARCRSEVARKLLAESEMKKSRNSLFGCGYGGWLLYTAASAGDSAFVRELVDRDPLLVFGEGEYGVTDILYAAARSKNSEVFRLVFDYAASPRFSQQGGGEVPSGYKLEIMNRALHAAARGGNLRLLKELLSDCSDDVLAYRDNQGATVLHAAAARGQVEVVKDLTSSSPDIIKSTDNQGNTALHVAAHRGHLPVVQALILSSPSSINATNNAGQTFLHTVVSGFQTPGFRRVDRQINLLKHLLGSQLFDIGQIINARDGNGRTALHLAITGNIHSDLVELLMTAPGIDVNIRDSSGMTPLDALRQLPHSSSSDLLTRQLMSAGGIFSCQDYSTRRAIASHIKRQSIGGSPGTSFRISDIEIFLYTGMDNASDGVGPGNSSPQVISHHDSNVETNNHGSSSSSNLPRKANSATERLKRFLHWPRMRKGTVTERLKKLVDETCPEKAPVPLRERFSNNKRTLSVRSNVPSPAAKKKLASGVMHGVMQAIPSFAGHHRSRSSSFSKLSMSSLSSVDTQKGGGQHENEIVKASCSTSVVSDDIYCGAKNHKKLMNQYLCFGGPTQHVEVPTSNLQPYDIYERSVLSAA